MSADEAQAETERSRQFPALATMGAQPSIYKKDMRGCPKNRAAHQLPPLTLCAGPVDMGNPISLLVVSSSLLQRTCARSVNADRAFSL